MNGMILFGRGSN